MSDIDTINLVAALEYAHRGWPILPLDDERISHIKGWEHKATTIEATIRRWWRRWPDAKIGILTGDDVIVLDIDCWQNLRALRNALGDDEVRWLFNEGYVVRTQRGFHIYFQSHPEIRSRVVKLFGSEKLDLRAGPHYVCAPPSRWQKDGKVGRRYTLVSDHPPLPLPPRIVAEARPAPFDDGLGDLERPRSAERRYGVTFEQAEAAAQRAGAYASGTIDEFSAHCPCDAHKHGDRKPSLTITRRRDNPAMAQFKCWLRPNDPAIYEIVTKAWGLWIYDEPSRNGDGGHDRQAGRSSRLIVTPLTDVEETPVVWLWPEHIPEAQLILLDGDPGIGKSTVAEDFLARGSVGADWPDGFPAGEPMNVGFMGTEDALDNTVKPRFMAAGGDPTRFYALQGYADENGVIQDFSFPRDLDLLEEAITTYELGMVFIDIIVGFSDKDANSQQKMRQLLAPFSQLAQRSGCVIIASRHFRKSSGETQSILDMGAGALSIVGTARLAMALVLDPEDDTDDINDRRRLLVVYKSNLGRIPPSLAWRFAPAPDREVAMIEWLGTSAVTGGDLFGSEERQTVRTEARDRTEWLADLLAEGSMTAAAVYAAGKQFGSWDPKSIWRSAKKLGVDIQHDESLGGGWRWTLTPKATAPGKVSPSSPSVAFGVCSRCGEPLTTGVGGGSVCTRCFRPRSHGEGD